MTKLVGPTLIAVAPAAGLAGGLVPAGWRFVPVLYAVLLTATFIFPASLLRPFGGWLSDWFGARRIMYVTFGVMRAASGALMMPYGHVVLAFGVLFVVTALAALWMHLTVYRILHAHAPHLSDAFEHPAGPQTGPARADDEKGAQALALRARSGDTVATLRP